MPLSLLRGSRGSQKKLSPRAGMFALTDLAKSWQNLGTIFVLDGPSSCITWVPYDDASEDCDAAKFFNYYLAIVDV